MKGFLAAPRDHARTRSWEEVERPRTAPSERLRTLPGASELVVEIAQLRTKTLTTSCSQLRHHGNYNGICP